MGSGNGGGVAPAARISTGDSIYVPVLPDVPNLPGENVQSGKHNTDCELLTCLIFRTFLSPTE